MHTANSFEHAGVTVNIYYDEDCPTNPRTDFTRGTTIAAWHRRSDIGDEGFNYRDISDHMGESPEDLIEWLKEEHGALVIKPLYLYEHSGQTLSLTPFSCRWDSGQVGFIFVTQEHLDDTGGDPDEMIEADVREYNSYLSGEVYGYIVAEDEDDEESCWGFIGDIEYCEQEAKVVAEGIAKRREAEREEAAEWAARDTVTI